jgi:VanZ family protein
MEQQPTGRGRWWWLVPILGGYWAFLFFLTHRQPGEGTLPGWDKVAHFTAYALLAGLFSVTLVAFGKRSLWWQLAIFLVVVSYGAADEYLQQFVPGRHPDVRDWLADAAGAAAALVLLMGFWPAKNSEPEAEPKNEKRLDT